MKSVATRCCARAAQQGNRPHSQHGNTLSTRDVKTKNKMMKGTPHDDKHRRNCERQKNGKRSEAGEAPVASMQSDIRMRSSGSKRSGSLFRYSLACAETRFLLSLLV